MGAEACPEEGEEARGEPLASAASATMGGAASGGGLECQGYCGLGWLKSGELIQATKIQAHVRGKQGRARALKLRKKTFTRRSALKLQMRATDEDSPKPGLHWQPSKAAPVPAAKRRPSAAAKRPDEALQEREEFEQPKALPSRLPAIPPEVAARKIQAAVRGHQARRRVARSRPRNARILSASRSELTDAQESEEGEDEEEDDEEEDEEEDDEDDGRSVAVLGPPVSETE
ncbi:unnamed protein product [Symbiodinium microadriaticum]|nr:unnamed protein product [Symbiodinium microadriaticum]